MSEKKGLIIRVWDAIFNREKRFTYQQYQDFGLIQGWSTTTESGESVSVQRGSKIGTVFNCVNSLAQDIAKLPYNVRQDSNQGRMVVKNHPVYRLIHTRPNNYTTAFNFWYQVVFSMLSHGNAYAFIKRKGVNPVELILLQSQDVEINLIDNEVFYKFKDVLYGQSDILHYKLYSFDGILGVSPIIWNAETLGYKLKQDKYKAKVLGTKPPGVLTFDQELNAEQYKENKEFWKSMTQGDNIGGTPVLSGGARYQPFMISPDEGQMIESAELNAEDILGMYRVPPTIIQKYGKANFANAENQDLVYVKYAITPIIQCIEQETDAKLFKESNLLAQNPFYTNFNIKGMLKGDTLTQIEFYRFMRDSGIMNPDEIREMEDLPPLPDGIGQMYTIQGANVPLDLLREFYKEKTGEQNQIGFDKKKLEEKISKAEILNKGK